MQKIVAVVLLVIVGVIGHSDEILDKNALDSYWNSKFLDSFNDSNELDSGNGIQPYLDLDKDVKFLLYTPNNPNEGQEISHLNLTSIISSNFIPNYPTRFYSHGWLSRGDSGKSLRKAYFDEGNHTLNFIGVNWPSRTANYYTARNRVFEVGPYLAEFIDTLVDARLLDLDEVHLIGHSLGAHVCGIAGKNIKSGKVRKIVGLDPAKPLFDYDNQTTRLDANDAFHVEIIHSNGGLLGFLEPIGTASFYPNGGRSQPGCSWDVTGACSHNRAVQFFCESIFSDTPFYATGCESYEEIVAGNCTETGQTSLMGGEPGNIDKIEGVFYLVTNKSKPFAISTNDTHLN